MKRRHFLQLSAAGALTAALPIPALASGAGTLAVLYFENGNPSDPRLEPLKVGLAQMMITDFTGRPGLRVVERARLQAILDELELGHSGVADPSTANRLGKLLSAEFLITGSYMEMLGTFRVDARLIKVETSEILESVGRTGKAEQFMTMEAELVAELWTGLRSQLGVDTRGTVPTELVPAPEDPLRGDPLIVAPNPKAVDAALAFSEGLIALDKKELPRARESFEAALAQAPDFEDAQAALASMEI